MVPIQTGRTHDGLIECSRRSATCCNTVVVTGNETLRDQAAVVIKAIPSTEDVTMKLIAFCIRYPVSVIVGMILALLLASSL